MVNRLLLEEEEASSLRLNVLQKIFKDIFLQAEDIRQKLGSTERKEEP